MKLLLNEPGSDWTRGCWSDSTARFASSLAYVEVRAALGAAHRSGRISSKGFRDAKREFDSIWDRVDECEPTIELISRGAQLAERHALRGYDAVHLATALHEFRQQKLYMLTSDDDLAQASFDAGISVITTSGA